ncbi:hypothetical protein ES708_10646 [subsurface metagenome]
MKRIDEYMVKKEVRKDRKLLKGAIDLHVHIDPDIRTPHRSQNGLECAYSMKENDMRAVIFKPLGLPSTGMAYIVNLLIEDFYAFGAITLNRCVGGLNPIAVKHALVQGDGAKAVWFPTSDSVHHAKFFSKGSYPFVEGYSKGLVKDRKEVFKKAYNLIRVKPEDAVVVFKNGKLVDEAKEIIDIVIKADVILGLGHMSVEEAFQFTEIANLHGAKKTVIPHPNWKVMDYSLKEMKKLAGMGAFLEFCSSGCEPQQYVSHGITPLDPNDIAVYIKNIGVEHCIMSTDSGMFSVPIPAESMRTFIALLLDAGIKEDEIDIMVRKNPAKLLNID